METAAEMTCSRRVSIMLPDEKQEYLTIAKAIGIEQDVIDAVRVPVGDAVSGRAFKLGRPVIADGISGTPFEKFNYQSHSFASQPMVYTAFKIGQVTVGVLNMTDRHDDRPFEPWELEFIDVLSSIAGSTIDEILSRHARDNAHDSIVIALATLAEYRDNDTGLHVDRVTQFSLLIARELQVSSPCAPQIDQLFLDNLRRAAPLHDIGKVAIPDAILLKPGRLDEEEIRVIRTHAAIGRDTIRSVLRRSAGVEFLHMAEDIAGNHHEWFNGSGKGYPENIAGDTIPLSARIVALADVYDAITSERVYKSAMTHEQARDIIIDASGTQFDPEIVNAFQRCEQDFARLARELADDQTIDDAIIENPGRRDVA